MFDNIIFLCVDMLRESDDVCASVVCFVKLKEVFLFFYVVVIASFVVFMGPSITSTLRSVVGRPGISEGGYHRKTFVCHMFRYAIVLA